MKHEIDGRREIASRNTTWANSIDRKLTGWDITPNQISMKSTLIALIGCLLFLSTVVYPSFNEYVAYILFIACMQYRTSLYLLSLPELPGFNAGGRRLLVFMTGKGRSCSKAKLKEKYQVISEEEEEN